METYSRNPTPSNVPEVEQNDLQQNPQFDFVSRSKLLSLEPFKSGGLPRYSRPDSSHLTPRTSHLTHLFLLRWWLKTTTAVLLGPRPPSRCPDSKRLRIGRAHAIC